MFVQYLDIVWCTLLFIVCIAYSSRRCLGVSLFKKNQDYKVQDFEQ
jgi:hypothetical protein